ncbi:MAG TPA: hypothetical protein VEB40_12475 [Flavipsychrobacter sp.]|nr:hypothetical protein [Flavipsychrobacter sp.]
MKTICYLVTMLLMLCIATTANAQKFKTKHKEQVKAIKAAYKARKITENEYNKLLDEQEVIMSTIEKYEQDGYLDAHEKNVIHDKQDRATHRLRRYKTNSERY